MLRFDLRLPLAVTLTCALFAATALADDCPACRAARGSGGVLKRGNLMGSVAYRDKLEHGEGNPGNPYASHKGFECRDRVYPNPDLFYNYYVHSACGGYPAQMYVSPLPVPANVGHTYITYQPLMPHEFMYKHHRTYHQYYDGGRGLTRTKVIWW
jgi:hypothetical protein